MQPASDILVTLVCSPQNIRPAPKTTYIPREEDDEENKCNGPGEVSTLQHE